MSKSVKVWDIPTRLFHWLLVVAIAFQYLSAEILDSFIQWHFYVGYFCIGLILFRIIWGMVGSHYAKFTQFVRTPKHALAYLSNKDTHTYVGHNPAGAYSVIVLLALVLTQALSGLFITDDIFSSGPYYGVLPKYWEDLANVVHHNAFNVLLAVIALHVSAILFHKFKHNENLTKAMITGRKDVIDAAEQEVKPYVNTPWLTFVLSAAASALIVYLIVVVWAPEPVDDFFSY